MPNLLNGAGTWHEARGWHKAGIFIRAEMANPLIDPRESMKDNSKALFVFNEPDANTCKTRVL